MLSTPVPFRVTRDCTKKKDLEMMVYHLLHRRLYVCTFLKPIAPTTRAMSERPQIDRLECEITALPTAPLYYEKPSTGGYVSERVI